MQTCTFYLVTQNMGCHLQEISKRQSFFFLFDDINLLLFCFKLTKIANWQIMGFSPGLFPKCMIFYLKMPILLFNTFFLWLMVKIWGSLKVMFSNLQFSVIHCIICNKFDKNLKGRKQKRNLSFDLQYMHIFVTDCINTVLEKIIKPIEKFTKVKK